LHIYKKKIKTLAPTEMNTTKLAQPSEPANWSARTILMSGLAIVATAATVVIVISVSAFTYKVKKISINKNN
jgi:hypothetical protein